MGRSGTSCPGAAGAGTGAAQADRISYLIDVAGPETGRARIGPPPGWQRVLLEATR